MDSPDRAVSARALALSHALARLRDKREKCLQGHEQVISIVRIMVDQLAPRPLGVSAKEQLRRTSHRVSLSKKYVDSIDPRVPQMVNSISIIIEKTKKRKQGGEENN